MSTRTDWAQAIRPLLKKYKNRKHPLDYHNVYQLLVMVILSAQSTDDAVNAMAPAFSAYPDTQSLAKAEPQDLFSYLHGIRNFANKAKWITAIARQIKTDSGIPLSMDELTELPGIGRKSASVILRGAGARAEGIIVDIHVIRVAPRLGITKETDPKKIELHLMKILPPAEWDVGMAMSFLGREICRPQPLCEKCLMNKVCTYFSKLPSKLPKHPG